MQKINPIFENKKIGEIAFFMENVNYLQFLKSAMLKDIKALKFKKLGITII